MRFFEQNLSEEEFNHRVAEMVRNYWTAKGHKVTTYAKSTGQGDGRGHGTVWMIASDLVNGSPAGKTWKSGRPR